MLGIAHLKLFDYIKAPFPKNITNILKNKTRKIFVCLNRKQWVKATQSFCKWLQCKYINLQLFVIMAL